MKLVKPSVRLIASPKIHWRELEESMQEVGGQVWFVNRQADTSAPEAEVLVEVGGRTCYRSWAPGLNPNVTKIREDRDAYLENILASAHGSVLEHASFSFVFRNVSRVLTHELARHRAGTATSQESMRYVRLTHVPMWIPEWAQDDQVLMDAIMSHLHREEEFQRWLANYFKVDGLGVTFSYKKEKTSFMRRFAPSGHATELIWTCNVRELRHVIETRTAPGAEEEIRLVFGMVAKIMQKECPVLFADFRELSDGHWEPQWRKV